MLIMKYFVFTRNHGASSSVCNAGKALISSFNRSHTNGNDATVIRIGRRGEIQSTGLMKGDHAAQQSHGVS